MAKADREHNQELLTKRDRELPPCPSISKEGYREQRGAGGADSGRGP